jgi:two-component system response regulator HydG
MAGKRILILEGERNTGTLLEHVLHSAGFIADLARTAEEAERRLSDTAYGLVIADWRLDDSDGIVVADKAAALGIKTVILTGYAFRIPASAVARHELWLKPICSAELIDAVERCLGSASATQ